ncbi:hypothetical protein SNE40_021395 [Patella caerulea]|uniref:Uncharacterized protein n=1 Tax=Patella caerulea TaxID=87958 RepID=A0AAN8IXH2_PATCE
MAQEGSFSFDPFLGLLPVVNISQWIDPNRLVDILGLGDAKSTAPSYTVDVTKPRKTYTAGKYRVTMTIVTAYFDLGRFKKGNSLYFSTDTYFDWASSFKFLMHPLVVYSDCKRFISRMKRFRKNQKNITRIVFTDRNQFWSYQILKEISQIFRKPRYPKFHPNTIVPGYSSAQHSKFAVVADAVRQDYFQTKHYAWLDVGYFRDIVNTHKKFILKIPRNFNPKKVAMNQVFPKPKPEPTMDKVFRRNMVWIGGGFFFGRRDVVLKFEEQYRRTVMYFISRGLMNTDQQILFALFSRRGRRKLKPKVDVQLYKPRGNGSVWFYLGYLCYTVI